MIAEGQVELSMAGLRLSQATAGKTASGTSAPGDKNGQQQKDGDGSQGNGHSRDGYSQMSWLDTLISWFILIIQLSIIGIMLWVIHNALRNINTIMRKMHDTRYKYIDDLDRFLNKTTNSFRDISASLDRMSAAFAGGTESVDRAAVVSSATWERAQSQETESSSRRMTEREFVDSCNRALANRPGALEEFNHWCEPNAYKRVPDFGYELQIDSSKDFDRADFWYVELEGQQGGLLFPGRGLQSGLAGMIAGDADQLSSVLDGIFEWSRGTTFSVRKPAHVARITRDRLQIRDVGSVVLPLS